MMRTSGGQRPAKPQKQSVRIDVIPIATIIREARMNLALTQRDMAVRTKLAERTIRRMEQGKPVLLHSLGEVAKVLKVEVNRLYIPRTRRGVDQAEYEAMVDTGKSFDVLSAGDAMLELMEQALARKLKEKDALVREIEASKKDIERFRALLTRARKGSTILTFIAQPALVARLIRPERLAVADVDSHVRAIRPLNGMLLTIPNLSREESYRAYLRISRRYCHGPDKGYGVSGVVIMNATFEGEPDPERPVAVVFVVRQKLPADALGPLALPAFVTVRFRRPAGIIEVDLPTDVIEQLPIQTL